MKESDPWVEPDLEKDEMVDDINVIRRMNASDKL
jgi:hypothetical protein